MALARTRLKGRKETRTFNAFPRECADHSNYIGMGAYAKVLLHELIHQYRGANNGDLSATWPQMAKRGWKSRDTLAKAIRELEGRGWIVRTRQGGRNLPTLFALTFHAIHECGGKLDVSATVTALGFWKSGANPWKEGPRLPATAKNKKAATPGGMTCHAERADLPRPACQQFGG